MRHRDPMSAVDVIATPIQGGLFDVPATPPYRRNRPTSVEAAGKARDSASIIRTKVLNLIARAGVDGLTVSELMDELHTDCRNSVAPRCTELASEKWDCVIRDSGFKRKGRYSNEIIWLLNDRLADKSSAGAGDSSLPTGSLSRGKPGADSFAR